MVRFPYAFWTDRYSYFLISNLQYYYTGVVPALTMSLSCLFCLCCFCLWLVFLYEHFVIVLRFTCVVFPILASLMFQARVLMYCRQTTGLVVYSCCGWWKVIDTTAAYTGRGSDHPFRGPIYHSNMIHHTPQLTFLKF